jgi:2-hydroxycyclohexanecarboxyl-CoA dehydrogenase
MQNGKISIVTGAGKGIGKVIAQSLAKMGAVVIILDKMQEEGQSTAKEIETQGGKAVAMEVEATDGQSVKDAIEKIITQWRRIDVLINNIGWNKPTPFLDSDEELWYQLLDINLMVPLRFCRWVLPYMQKQQYGRIVNIASLAGLVPWPGSIGYNAAKAGVIAITKSLAAATAEYNIRINCICPGATETDLFAQLRRDNPKYIENALSMVPMKRACQPEEIAKVALFLVSEDSSYMTGQRLSVDGGAFML